MTGDLFGEALSAEAGAPRLTQWSPADWLVQPDWQPALDAFWRSVQGVSLAAFVQSRLDAGAVVYPKHPLWALQLTPLSKVKVVILGQDPYHGQHQAQGLSFSVASGVKTPPSLRNIFKEFVGGLGAAWRVAAQYLLDSGRRSACQSRQARLGAVDRRFASRSGAHCACLCLHALGWTCPS